MDQSRRFCASCRRTPGSPRSPRQTLSRGSSSTPTERSRSPRRAAFPEPEREGVRRLPRRYRRADAARPHEPLTFRLVLHLHRQLFQHAGGRGGYLKTDPNYIVSYESGQREVVFEPPPPNETEFLLRETFDRYNARSATKWATRWCSSERLSSTSLPSIRSRTATAAWPGCSPPTSSFGGLRRREYVSLEQRIYDSKNTYYQRLLRVPAGTGIPASTRSGPGSRTCAHPLGGLRRLRGQRCERAQHVGNKQDRARHTSWSRRPELSAPRHRASIPGVSLATIRLVLNELRDEGLIAVDGGGAGARWRRN